jgi:hypothetical protein
MEPNRFCGFETVRLGSISLILLSPLLFPLDLWLDGTVLWRRIASQHPDSRVVPLEETP